MKVKTIGFSFVVDFAAEMAHFGLFFNMGECCTAASRCYVQEDVYDRFVDKSVRLARKRIIGDPFNSATESGPQVKLSDSGLALSL